VAWSVKTRMIESETTFKFEFFHKHSADSIHFIKTTGLCPEEKNMSHMAFSVEDSDGVFFIPEVCGFVGIKQATKKQHLVRAVLENIVFNIGFYYYSMRNESIYQPSTIRIDGGIAQNDFICQQIANLIGVNIERSKYCSQLTSIGCAYLSAYNCGFLQQLEDAEKFYKAEKVFSVDSTAREMLMMYYQKFLKISNKI
jgi:glycerol kinase